ncbi:MAG: XisI protein, partial [Microcoleus sp. T1-bin1]|nr:XisI protein [Microcoleus sp. T1-bin1]
MDRLAKYRQIVCTFLMEYSKTKPINGDLEIQVLFDTEHDHYQIVDLGWDGHNRIYSCPIHLDIRDGKVWIQRNQTDELIAEELVLMGVAREDIVLGVQPPYA